MGVVRHTVGEAAAHDGRQQNRHGSPRARLVRIAAQVRGILFRRGVAGRIGLFLVVVPELDENVVARPQFVANALPPPLVAERLGGTTVDRMVADRDRAVEQGLEQLSPPPLGILFRELLRGAGRIADQVDAQVPSAGGKHKQQTDRQQKSTFHLRLRFRRFLFQGSIAAADGLRGGNLPDEEMEIDLDIGIDALRVERLGVGVGGVVRVEP